MMMTTQAFVVIAFSVLSKDVWVPKKSDITSVHMHDEFQWCADYILYNCYKYSSTSTDMNNAYRHIRYK